MVFRLKRKKDNANYTSKRVFASGSFSFINLGLVYVANTMKNT